MIDELHFSLPVKGGMLKNVAKTCEEIGAGARQDTLTPLADIRPESFKFSQMNFANG